MAINDASIDSVRVSGISANRNFEHRFFAVVATLFVLSVLIGFGPTFYLKPLFNFPPIARSIIWVHAIVMSAWVLLVIAQVYLISSKQIRLHQKLGFVGVGLSVALVISGFFLSIAATKYGTAAAPPQIPPLEFMIVSVGDLFVFSILFGAAIYYRKTSANHKRLILLTMLLLLAPAIARFPGGMTDTYGPLYFYGVPTLLTIIFIAADTWRTGKLNKVFLFAGIFFIAAMWLRLPLSSTPLWLNFAAWLTS